MATLSDDFTGGYQSFWTEFDENGYGTVAASGTLQLSATSGDYDYETAIGLVTTNTYDMTAPSDLEVDFSKVDSESFLQIGTSKVTASGEHPYDENYWYRWGRDSAGNAIAQKKTTGSVSTIYSGSEAAVATWKIDITTGSPEVEFYHDAAKPTGAEDSSNILDSTDCYLYVYGWIAYHYGDGTRDEADFDNFAATYTAAGGGLGIPLIMHDRRMRYNG